MFYKISNESHNLWYRRLLKLFKLPRVMYSFIVLLKLWSIYLRFFSYHFFLSFLQEMFHVPRWPVWHFLRWDVTKNHVQRHRKWVYSISMGTISDGIHHCKMMDMSRPWLSTLEHFKGIFYKYFFLRLNV